MCLWGVDMEWQSINGNNDKLPMVGQICLIAIDCKPNVERAVYKGDGIWLSNWFNRRGKGHNYKVVGWAPFADPEL